MLEQDNDKVFDEAFLEFTEDAAPASAVNTEDAEEDTSTDGDVTNTENTSTDISADSSDTIDGIVPTENTDKQLSVEEAVAQAKQWENKFKSYQGRMNIELERRREEELVRQQQFLDLLQKTNTPVKDNADVKTVLPPKFDTFLKDFPEFAEPVLELLNARLEDTKNVVGTLVDQRVKPITATLEQQKAASHMSAILSKHPDAVDLHRTGALDNWINTLPVFMRSAANHVLADGSAAEVVALLDQYKTTTSTKNTNTTKNTDKPTENASKPLSEQDLLAAVQGGLAVRAGRSGDPRTDNKSTNANDAESGWEKALKDFGFNK